MNANIRVYNKSFVAVGILEDVESVIWVECYQKPGNFEIFTKFNAEAAYLLQKDNYLVNPESSVVMIVEQIRIKTDAESGDKLIVKGRSIESLLARRIILRQIIIDTTLQAGIHAILDADVINSVYPERNFDNFIFEDSTDPAVTSITLKAQYYSQNLLDTITYLCTQVGLGFRVVLNASNQFVFQLYSGKDRSYNQLTNSYVVFSPNFDNLISSDYLESNDMLRTYALVSGDPTNLIGQYPVRMQVPNPRLGSFLTGIDRREMFVDASDMSAYVLGTATLQDATVYQNQLIQRGKEELAQNDEIITFDGQLDLNKSFAYGIDFFLGDQVQIIDAYGHSSIVRIAEITTSNNLSGKTVFPTLSTY